MTDRVSIVGLGKLGACMAAAMASRGRDVVGVDVSTGVVDSINQGCPPVLEPGLGELIAANKARLRATVDIEEAVRDSDVTFIVVPTPSDENGAFSLRYVSEAARRIGRALRSKGEYHLVVLTSTVLPGASDTTVLPILEAESGKRTGEAFGYCYSPEFIALGSVIRDFLNPDLVLIGETDERAGALLASFYESVLGKPVPIARMSCTNAELTKLSVNTYVTMKIAFANTIANLCERLPGGDVDVVTKAIGLDTRIGRRYLTGALGYAGPCFPRDNVALSHFARSLGVEALLAESTQALNQRRVSEIARLVETEAEPGATIAVLGLSYKPSTSVIDESQGLQLAVRLADRGYHVLAYDPLAMDQAKSELGGRVGLVRLHEAIIHADVVVIANADEEFGSLSADDFLRGGKRVVVIDCWRLLREKLSADSRLRYVGVGLAQDDLPRD